MQLILDAESKRHLAERLPLFVSKLTKAVGNRVKMFCFNKETSVVALGSDAVAVEHLFWSKDLDVLGRHSKTLEEDP